MKALNYISLVLLSLCGHYIVNLHQQNYLLQLNSQIQDEQIADYHHELISLSSRRTYEEGVRDGFENTQNINYTMGYHAAISQNNNSPIITTSVESE